MVPRSLCHAQDLCIAALRKAFPEETASDATVVKREIAIVCIFRGMCPTSAGFIIKPTPLSAVNYTFQRVTKHTAFFEHKIRNVVQLPELREAFEFTTRYLSNKQVNAVQIHLQALLPNASQEIRSMFPDITWPQPPPTAYKSFKAFASAPNVIKVMPATTNAPARATPTPSTAASAFSFGNPFTQEPSSALPPTLSQQPTTSAPQDRIALLSPSRPPQRMPRTVLTLRAVPTPTSAAA